MYDVSTFNHEIGFIKCPDIQRFVRSMLGKALPYFWSVPSSSGGKYHPPQSNGEGGLVRHSKAVAYFASAFSRSFGLSQRDTDRAIAAGILHDLCKYGIPGGKFTTPIHEKETADYVGALGTAYIGTGEAGTFTKDDLQEICRGIAHHAGPWIKHDRKKAFPEEYSKLEIVVHISDMAAAQKEVGLLYLMEPTVGIG